jgi:uncharacterized membrane protein
MKNLLARIFALALFATLLPSSLAAQDKFTFTSIKAPDGSDTFAFGINARGDVVGIDGTGSYLLHNHLLSPVPPPTGGTINAHAINAERDIAGIFADAKGPHGFFLHEGKFHFIDFPGAVATRVRGVNNAGDVTGSYVDASGVVHGFIRKDGEFKHIHVNNSAATDVYGSKDNGEVLVGDAVLNPDLSNHGFIKTRDDGFRIIDYPGTKTPCTHVRGINERGDIVGFYSIVSSVAECNNMPLAHGFLLRQGHYMTVDYPGAEDSLLMSINDDGVMVGIVNDRVRVKITGFRATPKD